MSDLPPHSLRAEASILSAMMAYPEAAETAAKLVEPGDLYSMAHQAVFDTIVGLNRSGYVSNSAAVIERLTNVGRLADVGGQEGLMRIASTPGSHRDLERNTHTVAATAALRRFAAGGRELEAVAMDPESDPAKVFEQVKRMAESAVSGSLSAGAVRASDGVAEHRLTADVPLATVPTGMSGVDRLSGGYVKGYLNLVGAPSGGGKTSFIGQSIVAACKAGRPVLFQSLEMTTGEVYDRLASQLSGVPLYKITQRSMTTTERERRNSGYDAIEGWPLDVDASKNPTIASMSMNARATAKEYGEVAVVFFDYLQYWRPKVDNVFSREGEVAAAGHMLNDFAAEIEAPVVAGVQLNNKAADRADKRPTMWDIRESSAPYHDAAAVMFLYREGYYNRMLQGPDANVTEVIVDKNRNGPPGTVYADWVPHLSVFAPRPDHVAADGMSPSERLASVTAKPSMGDDGATPYDAHPAEQF